MVREFDPSNNESEFVHEALSEGIRVDGRGLLDVRNVKLSFNGTSGYAECRLGETIVAAQVSAEVVRPSPERPYEGMLNVSSEITPMAASSYENGRPSEEEVIISRQLEKALRRSGAIDLESLCILASQKVWSIRVDLHFLNDQGNMVDCASIAAITALRHFRRPDVSLVGEEVTVHSFEERVPIGLAIHHSPICVSFSFFQDGSIAIIDPNHLESQLCSGSMTLVLNAQSEICVFSKTGGAPISADEIMRLVNIASKRSKHVESLIKNALQEQDKK